MNDKLQIRNDKRDNTHNSFNDEQINEFSEIAEQKKNAGITLKYNQDVYQLRNQRSAVHMHELESHVDFDLTINGERDKNGDWEWETHFNILSN